MTACAQSSTSAQWLEIDYQDLWQRGLVATCVTVSPDPAFAEQVLQSVEREAVSLLGPLLVGVTTEWLA